MVIPFPPACDRARDLLIENEAIPQSKYQPRGPTSYFPRSQIDKVFNDIPAREVFTCRCERCLFYSRDKKDTDDDNRGLLFKSNDFTKNTGRYTTVFALLIYTGYAGLIPLFRRKEAFLGHRHYLTEDQLTSYLSEHESFKKLAQGLRETKKNAIRRDLLENQHRFEIRQIEPSTSIISIGEQEILAIEEDADPVGKGDFGEVYGLTIPDEYVHEELRENRKIKRYARKIFDQRWNRENAAREWIMDLYASKLEHDHLMEALAAFEHGSLFFILFELADCTLHQLLKGEGVTFGSSLALWRQVQGVTSGLKYLHNRSVAEEKETWVDGRMYHMDLKPTNILVVRGIMKIADFGLSNYKLWPQLSESRLEGDSKHDGFGLYAPPPGPVTELYDIFSLGAVLSEISAFDIGGSSEVTQYRDRRREDQGHGSIRFHYHPSAADLKRSVLEEHETLYRSVEGSKDAPDGAGLDPWQQSFYTLGFFEKIKSLLSKSENDRPQADEVLKFLDDRINRASRTTNHRGSDTHPLNIWEETIEGTIDETPPDKNYRLRAYLGENPCGLWVVPAKSSKIRIQRFINHQRFRSDTITVDRKNRDPFDAIQPRYMENPSHLPTESLNKHVLRNAGLASSGAAQALLMELRYTESKPPDRYRFITFWEALRFQTLFTGEHVYCNMSLHLSEITFHKYKRNRMKRDPPAVKLSTKQPIQGPAHVQIWTNHEVKAKAVPTGKSNTKLDKSPETREKPEAKDLRVKIAIITEHNVLILIASKNEIERDSKELLADANAPSSSIRLNKSDIMSLEPPAPNGIPVMLKDFHHKYVKPNDDEIRLHCTDSEEVRIFWERLRAVQDQVAAATRHPGIITMVHGAGI